MTKKIENIDLTIRKIQELLRAPQQFLEEEFSPYFCRYYVRYSHPKKFEGYLRFCKHLFSVTEARNAKILDLGCGFGLLSILLGLEGAKEVVGYDLNMEKIHLFNKFIGYLGEEVKNVKPLLGDSVRIEFPALTFDVVIANEVFSHIRDCDTSLREVFRVLKPGGRFLVRDGNNSLFLPGRIKRRRFWRRIEHGPVEPAWFRSTDVPFPYSQIRKKMIADQFPEVDNKQIEMLSRETAGLYGREIIEMVMKFENNGKIIQKPKFPYRNPITGEFPEREINPFVFSKRLKKLGFEVSFVPYFYPGPLNDFEMAVKTFFFWIDKYIPKAHLFLNPGFAILGTK
jgi:ubiquinone/menaquinone biosynthesis C-methylase UbiE